MKTIIKITQHLVYFALLSCMTLSCMDKGDEVRLEEFGAKNTEIILEVEGGTSSVDFLTNLNCEASIAEGGEWLTINTNKFKGDQSIELTYTTNDGFPRMALLCVNAPGTQCTDTIYIKQKGAVEPQIHLPISSLVVAGGKDDISSTEFNTNVNFNEMEIETTYTSDDEGQWIKNITYQDGTINLETTANPDDLNLRTATVNLIYKNGWNEKQTETLYVIQRTASEALGRNVSFEDVRNMADIDLSKNISEYIIITGYVVSNKTSRNAGNNPMLSNTTTDHTVCDKTIYLESLDGKYGFSIQTETEEDNIFEQYDKVQLLLFGTKIIGYNNPERYEISGLKSSMIVARENESKAAIPTKEKYIDELTDNDIYTYITLKDCEFPVRKGSLTPIHEGYTLADKTVRLNKYPRLMRDIKGSIIYLLTNTTCPYRRNGVKLPYGSGNISGVVVKEYFPQYEYNDAPIADNYGNIGRYQLRHQSYEDIAFSDKESFSQILTEYRYQKDKVTDPEDGYMYWYPTYGNNGRFCHSAKDKYANGCYGVTSWNYIGWIGTAKGTAPFKNHIGNDGSGMGIILEDGTNYIPAGTINSDGKGQSTKSLDNWANIYWWDNTLNRGECWRIEFSTEGISTNNLSMQISVQGGRSYTDCSPIYWKAEWSLTGEFYDDSKWNYIASYTIPDFPIWANQMMWQLPAYKQINFKLPLEMLGHKKVYIRLTPENNKANSATVFAGSFINQGGKDSGSAMDYFAIRYNK